MAKSMKIILIYISIHFISICCNGERFRYIGCYEHFTTSSMKTSVQSANECIHHCQNSSFLFAALQNETECYCGKTINYTVPSSNCNLTCSDNIDTCGGIQFYSIYLVEHFDRTKYLGCYLYSDNEWKEYVWDGSMTNDWCLNHCSKLNYKFMTTKREFLIVESYKKCSCTNNLTSSPKISENKCNTKCAGNSSKKCGGVSDAWIGSVYEIENFDRAKYLGCYLYFDDEWEESVRNISMTNDWCLNYCSKLNYHFMASYWSDECYCTNKLPSSTKINENKCNTKCAGNSSQKCGGYYQRVANVYEMCSSSALNKICSEMFHCKDIGIDENGKCPTKKCIKGWKGDSCSQRDCSIQNGLCGEHKCQEFVIGNTNVSECVCNEGFQSVGSTIFDIECRDIDECESTSVCDLQSTTCENTEGGYTCNCKYGFKDLLDNQCSDINECDEEMHNCNLSTTNCNNTYGSFQCDCKDGFTEMIGSNSTCSDESNFVGETHGIVFGTLLILLVVVIVSIVIWRFATKKKIKSSKK